MTGHDFLARLADPARPRVPEPVLAVVAHPDDETIGFGGQMDRFEALVIVHVTDGAPADPAYATRAGYPDPQSYAAARRAELAEAVALAGLSPERLVSLGHVDQTARDHLVPIARAIAGLLESHQPVAVLTHAYEGGHPDHDATAFAVDAAQRLADTAPTVIAMPFYHRGDAGFTAQVFADPAPEDVAIPLPADALARKRAMLAAHRSQADVLAMMTASDERYRAHPAPDFTRLPNRDRLHYEGFGWGQTGSEWLDRAAAARRELAS